MVDIKTEEEIEIMREGGKIAARILNILAASVKPGIKTIDLDTIAAREISDAGAKASFLGYAGYPKSICTSVNNEVVHGIPGNRILKEGDIVGIDLGILFKGFHTDTAITVGVGKIGYEEKQLINIAKTALQEGISLIKPGIFLGDIQNRIQNVIESASFGVIRDLAGHGIGRQLQENPSIPNYGRRKSGLIIKKGMVFAFEPMISQGDWHVKIMSDGWTVETVDGLKSSHFEHTVAVVRDGYQILTQ